MTDKDLSRKELLERLGIWYFEWTKAYTALVESRTIFEHPRSRKAYNQIRKIIEKYPYLEEKS